MGNNDIVPGFEEDKDESLKIQLEKVDEYRLELVCSDEKVPAVAEALKRAHPYEEPAYHFVKAEGF